MDDHFYRSGKKYSVAEAKSHFSEILAQVETGQDVLITRRGVVVARLSGLERPLRHPEWGAIDSFRNSLPVAAETSESLVRRLRDDGF